MWLENLHDQRKVEMLKPYIGYQYGTAVYLTGTICEKKEQDRLLERLYSQEHILSWTKNRKVRILQAINQIGGLCLVMILLKLRSKIRG